MNVAPVPIESPYRVGLDHLSDHQRDRVRQAEAAVSSLQRSGAVGDGAAASAIPIPPTNATADPEKPHQQANLKRSPRLKGPPLL
jgi:hypothetical protein